MRTSSRQSRVERLAELLDYRPQLAPLNLSRCAENALSANGHRARWSSGLLLVEIGKDRRDQHLQVSLGYRTLWTQLLPAKVDAGEAEGFLVHFRPSNADYFYITLADVPREEARRRSVSE